MEYVLVFEVWLDSLAVWGEVVWRDGASMSKDECEFLKVGLVKEFVERGFEVSARCMVR